MKNPLVSVVSPCFNGEKYIRRFFDSVINQTYPDLELVFIDDGSTDGTEKIAEEYRPRFEERGIRFIYEYQQNAGQASALNRGLKLFSGEYMNWMDSDDEILPHFIESKVEYLESHPECAYCCGKAVIVIEDAPNEIIDTIGKRTHKEFHGFFEDVLYLKEVFFSGYLVRTSALDRAVPSREIYAGEGGQNAQLLLPLAWEYGEPAYVEESVYKYYVRQDSHSHSQDTSRKMIRQLERYEKILLETISRIGDREADAYIPEIKKHYARLRFGNAVDTMDPELIRAKYRALKELGIVKPHDTAMLAKYSLRSWIKG